MNSPAEKSPVDTRSLETIELLRGNLGKQDFMEGRIENPHTPSLSVHAEIVANQYDWTSKDVDMLWNATGLAGEAQFSGAAYRLAQVNYLRTLRAMQKLRMLRERGHLVDQSQWDHAIDRVSQSGSELFGEIDKNEFDNLLSDYFTSAMTESDLPEITQIQSELIALLGVSAPVQTEVSEHPKLIDRYTNEQQFEKISSFVQRDFAEHFEGIDDKSKYTPEEIVEIFERAVIAEGEVFSQVRVIFANASNITAQARDQVFEIGQNLKPQTGNWVKGMIAHEFWHMRRSLLAPDDSDESRFGQDTYITFEEGIGPALEDAARGKLYPHGDRHYLAAGLVIGFDRGPKRDFRATYEILWRLELLKECASIKDLTVERLTKLTAQRKNTAFDGIVRIKRGTGFDIAGTIHPLALNYKNGQPKGWAYLNTITSYEEYLSMFYTGKYDLLDDRHTSYRQVA